MKKNPKYIIIFLLLVIILFMMIKSSPIKKNLETMNNKQKIRIDNFLTRDKYNSLVKILGKPNYLETDGENKMKSATWQSPLDNFNDFGKYLGCDYIKILGEPSKKYHPHPANVFVIVGKYIKVPEHLFGPIKYGSETINIEQLLIPKQFNEKYYETGIKEIALVTGSCASITISAITVQFVIDMIEKYKDTIKSLELYDIFRKEYDRRIDDFLCGRGITDPIDWYDPSYFEETDKAYLGDKICKKSPSLSFIKEGFYVHAEGCEEEMAGQTADEFCKNKKEHKCC